MENRFGEIGIVALSSFKDRAEKINNYINEKRCENKNYLIQVDDVRFANGEGKVKLKETVKNKDIFTISSMGGMASAISQFLTDERLTPSAFARSC